MIFIVFTRFHGRISRQGSICEVASTRNELYDAQKQQVERRDDRRSACVSMFVFASIYRLSTPRYVPSIAFYVERERVSCEGFPDARNSPVDISLTCSTFCLIRSRVICTSFAALRHISRETRPSTADSRYAKVNRDLSRWFLSRPKYFQASVRRY